MTHTPPTRRGLALAAHTRRTYQNQPCPHDCAICTELTGRRPQPPAIDTRPPAA